MISRRRAVKLALELSILAVPFVRYLFAIAVLNFYNIIMKQRISSKVVSSHVHKSCLSIDAGNLPIATTLRMTSAAGYL